ncbi:Exodeoxyribonuclease VII large subunit [Cognatiyoonia koreensis]|uniref:Exodeoxyribonuclease 7 large subunit n=1 Tax=Cognatiyoonia koreensis TaxID=364200 RepID=A0A1I0NFA5_9RHOB|nr:exodeoxyribonuclease VII large subunit [Cognatiyoonia koreensis]SEV99446.1 Exodeoxyribonuclease VII large subunit [Cognatiyoonia koreensis]
MDLFEEETPKGNAPEFTVSELTGSVKKTLEGAFGRVRVRGEVGRVVRAKSGHLYYDIKDDRNVIACNSWKGQVAGLGVQPEEGLEVIVTGKLSTFGPQSKYNINVDSIEVAGEGALMAMLEKRKKALAAEGLFAPERKKPLPYLPEIIGVVTSPSGAVIRDILHRLRDRFPRKVLVWPVAVQGQNCAPEVARAIAGFNALTPGGALPRPDLIIVARGGGSIEDLWGFNEEIVARAAAASDIPLISAVGHETDTTLIDFVSDMRAPTPTAAAELAVPVRMELLGWVDQQGGRLNYAASAGLEQRKQRLRDLARALPKPGALLDTPQQRFDYWAEKLPVALIQAAQKKKLQLANLGLRPSVLTGRMGQEHRRLNELTARLGPALTRGVAARRDGFRRVTLRAPDVHRAYTAYDTLAARLAAIATRQQSERVARLESLDRLRETLGYRETLKRGYAVVRDGEALVTHVDAAKAAKSLEIEFADGRVLLQGAGTKKSKSDSTDDQGRLL